MPFCSSCGNSVNAADQYCAKCGARQPGTPVQPVDPLSGITPRTASILCYIPGIGWIDSVIVLASHKFRDIPHMFRIDQLLHALILIVWVFMIVKTSHEEMYSLPIIGELAERSAAEH